MANNFNTGDTGAYLQKAGGRMTGDLQIADGHPIVFDDINQFGYIINDINNVFGYGASLCVFAVPAGRLWLVNGDAFDPAVVYIGNLGVNMGPDVTPDAALDVRADIMIVGDGSASGRYRFRGFFTATPSDPPTNQADIQIVDNGVTPVLRVRYNDNGVMKTGDLALV